jgi:hypothetical protein
MPKKNITPPSGRAGQDGSNTPKRPFLVHQEPSSPSRPLSHHRPARRPIFLSWSTDQSFFRSRCLYIDSSPVKPTSPFVTIISRGPPFQPTHLRALSLQTMSQGVGSAETGETGARALGGLQANIAGALLVLNLPVYCGHHTPPTASLQRSHL